MYCPGYYIAVSHEHASIIVVFRGTMRPQDVLTDLVCKPVPMTSGTREGAEAHEGFLSAAEKIDVRLYSIVQEALQRHPGYTVTICGHSLGAGVASILTMLWQGRFGDEVKVSAWAFASPCTVDLETARLCSDFITAVVVGILVRSHPPPPAHPPLSLIVYSIYY